MERVAWIGFGEAATAFADNVRVGAAIGYDRKTDDDASRAAKLADFARHAVSPADSTAAAVRDAGAVLSLVTADQSLAAARAAAPHLMPGAFFFDMNSVAPDTKRDAARVIAASGACYLDVAVMAPVLPKRCAVPLLVAGDAAEEGAAVLRALGFSTVATITGGVGAASAVKMIRSVMVKGIEALSAECALAAEAAGVIGPVIASLDGSWPGADWAGRFDYNLDRMMVHGTRRAAEMEEAVKTLGALGIDAALTRGTVERQRAIGGLCVAPPEGLAAKLAVLRPFTHLTGNRAA